MSHGRPAVVLISVEDLESLEAEVTDMAVLARQSLRRSLDVLDGNDASLSEAVIRGDDEVDRRY